MDEYEFEPLGTGHCRELARKDCDVIHGSHMNSITGSWTINKIERNCRLASNDWNLHGRRGAADGYYWAVRRVDSGSGKLVALLGFHAEFHRKDKIFTSRAFFSPSLTPREVRPLLLQEAANRFSALRPDEPLVWSLATRADTVEDYEKAGYLVLFDGVPKAPTEPKRKLHPPRKVTVVARLF